MKSSPKHLLLYKKIALLFMRHVRPAILEQSSFLSDAAAGDEDSKGSEDPKAFARALEDMGPTFVKLGQLLSTRGDLMPTRYIMALERLQDDVHPVPYSEIAAVLEKSLGVRISNVFNHFDEKPMASASLGQVHRAVLKSGQEVVVKVQRPGIRPQIGIELEALAEVADYADERTELGRKYRFSGIIEQFRRSLMDELDYNLEAQNLKSMRAALRDFPSLVVPYPFDAYCSGKVLTMEYIKGRKVTEISGASKTEMDGEAIADEIFKAYLHQVLIEGFYHADPHPGNLLIMPDNRVGVIDLGMVGRISERMRDELFNLMAGIADNDADKVAEVAIRIGESVDSVPNRRAFVGKLAELVGRTHNASVSEMQFGSTVMEIMRICAEHRIAIPREISLLGKTLLNLDRVGMALSPSFNPNASIQNNISALARKRSLHSLRSGSLLSGVIELKELLARSPQRFNDLLANLSENNFKVKIDAIDERRLIQGFQKIANRITMGAIIGAMIIGASYMMRVETEFQILGYPGLPALLFMFAAVCGVCVVVSIIKNDD